MVQLIRAERKSAVLTPSSLACLARVPTVNLTAGCAHECRYCYARGYLTHPGEGKVALYVNTLDKLRDELRRKRKKPATVYFSPSSDPFQPVPEVLDMAHDVFEHLFDSGVGVTFVTKGRIPERHRALLAAHAPLVQGRIGVTTLDPRIAAAFEPRAAPPEVRLAQAAELIAAGIPIDARLDPILPGLTDGEEQLEPLCEALARAGVRTLAASVLFLRPAVIGSLRRHVGDCPNFRGESGVAIQSDVAAAKMGLSPLDSSEMLQTMLDRFAAAQHMTIHAGNSRVTALPASARLEIMNRLKTIAHRHGLRVLVCACKNPDITNVSCHISGRWPPVVDGDSQLALFQPQQINS